MRPFDAAAVGPFERVATPLQLLLKLGMDREAVRYREQLAVSLVSTSTATAVAGSGVVCRVMRCVSSAPGALPDFTACCIAASRW